MPKKYSDYVRKGIARRIAAVAEKLGIKVSDEWKKKTWNLIEF